MTPIQKRRIARGFGAKGMLGSAPAPHPPAPPSPGFVESTVIPAMQGYADRRTIEALNQRLSQPEVGFMDRITSPIEYMFGRAAQGAVDQFGTIKQVLSGEGITPEQNLGLMLSLPAGGLMGSVPEGAFGANALIRSGKIKPVPEAEIQLLADRGKPVGSVYDQALREAAEAPPIPGTVVPDLRYTNVPLLNGTEEIPKFKTINEFHSWLDDRYRAKGMEPMTEYTPENSQKVAALIAEETAAALARDGNASAWYRDSIDKAMRYVETRFPELKSPSRMGDNGGPTMLTGPQSAFRVALAVTSNGVDVGMNADVALKTYQFFKENGRMPTSKDEVQLPGKSAPSMYKGFELYNTLLNDKFKGDLDAMTDFLSEDFTVKELREVTGKKSLMGGELTNTKVKGSAILGPKIGQGFYQNLSGNWDTLTADLWFSRTWGRLTGQSRRPINADSFNDQRAELLEAARNTKNLKKKYGVTATELKNDLSKLVDFANARNREYAASGYNDKTKINTTSKNLSEALNVSMDTPDLLKSPGQGRAFQRQTLREAQRILRDQFGTELDIADIQALIWYAEKDVAKKAGVAGAKAEGMSYDQAFDQIINQGGLTKKAKESKDASKSVGGDRPRNGSGSGRGSRKDSGATSGKPRRASASSRSRTSKAPSENGAEAISEAVLNRLDKMDRGGR